MTVQYRITRILSTLLIAGLCSAPLLRAQQTNPATPQQAPETSQQPQQPTTTQPAPTQTSPTQPATTQPGTTQPGATQPATKPAQPATPAQNTQPAAPANQNQPQQPVPSGTTVNPSQAPLNPVTTYPDASDSSSSHRPMLRPLRLRPRLRFRKGHSPRRRLSLWAPRLLKAFPQPEERRRNRRASRLLRPSSTRRALC